MAIYVPSSLSAEQLVGKFACKDSLMTHQYLGRPFLITKVKGKRVYFKEADRKWHRDGTPAGGYTWAAPDEHTLEEFCSLSSLRAVWDTLPEAIGAFDAARRVFQEHLDFEKRQKEEFFTGLRANTLPEVVARLSKETHDDIVWPALVEPQSVTEPAKAEKPATKTASAKKKVVREK